MVAQWVFMEPQSCIGCVRSLSRFKQGFGGHTTRTSRGFEVDFVFS